MAGTGRIPLWLVALVGGLLFYRLKPFIVDNEKRSKETSKKGLLTQLVRAHPW